MNNAWPGHAERRPYEGDAKRPSNLLSDARATPEGIALFGGDDRLNEFLGRPLGTGLGPAFRGEEQAVLVLSQDWVKVQEGRRLQHDSRADPPGGPHEKGTPTSEDAIREAEVRSALAGAMEDQQLMFE